MMIYSLIFITILSLRAFLGFSRDIRRERKAGMSGGPRDILGQLKDKYGERVTREIVFAAAAAWGLESNARQHSFLDKFLTSYITENSGSPAAKVLSALRPRKRN